MNIQDFSEHLKPELVSGNVVAFVGAGLSVGAGLPDWYNLISELAQNVKYELPPPKWITGDMLIDAAQYYINRQGLHSLVMFLKDRLDTTNNKPTAAHQALARLPISLVFTANYDDLLERAYKEAGKRVQVVVNDRAIPFMRRDPDVVNIIKLYGDLDQPETIVLARHQFEAFFLQRPQMIKLLETELGRSTMLYLGWSHSDPHFNLVFGELLVRFGQFMRAGYAVMFDISEAQQRELERKQIRIVQLPENQDRTTQLAAWLNGLAV
jgi:SIR2-like protein